MLFDPTTPFGSRVARRLEDEWIIWLTTLAPDGSPLPIPVWFLWDGESFLIYTRPNAPKLRNITHHTRVSLNFDGDRQGGDIIVFTGVAQLEPNAPPPDQLPSYVAKYAEGIKRIGMDATSFANAYSTAIRIIPDKVRGH